jgi:hypothetical protein
LAQLVLQQRFVQAKARGTALISNLRATLDATVSTINLDDYGVGKQANPTIVLASNAHNGSLLGGFPSNSPPGSKAIAFDRATRQVSTSSTASRMRRAACFSRRG